MIRFELVKAGDVLFRYVRTRRGRESYRIVIVEIDHAGGFAVCSDNNNAARRYPKATVERWYRKPAQGGRR